MDRGSINTVLSGDRAITEKTGEKMCYRVETVSVETVKELCDLQNQYSREVFQYNGEMEPGFYRNFPPLEGGKNVFCVLDSRNKMLGYSMVFKPLIHEESPEDVDYELWCDLTILPSFQDNPTIQDLLFARIIDRATEISQELPQRRFQLMKGIYPSEAYSLALFESKGLREKEKSQTFLVEIPERPAETDLPEGVEIRRFLPQGRAEKMQYLQAHNKVFSETPFDLEGLDEHFQSEGWTVGTLICAFSAEGDIVAGIKAYTVKDGPSDERTGITDSIFTLPGWRGRGYAKRLLHDALCFFYEKGIRKSCLEVSSVNVAAQRLYAAMGYKVVREKIIVMKPL